MNHPGKLRNMASVYIRRNGKILLLWRQGNSIVNNLWIGSAGGHFTCDELNDAKACVLRELKEETSLEESHLSNLSLRYITLRHIDGEVRQNYYFFADLSENAPDEITSNEGKLHWFTAPELAALPMPFTARFMIDHYLVTGQFSEDLYGGIADNETVTFMKL